MTSRTPYKVLTCCECGEEFGFTPDAQEYFAKRGFHRDPLRCKSCFSAIKKSRPVTVAGDRPSSSNAMRHLA